MVRDNLALWSSERWYADATAWLLAALRAAGRRPTGPVEQPRIRIWSTQLTVDTAQGRVWFKENTPPCAFEASLVALLDRLAPGSVLPPLAVEPARGWLLSPDGGHTLRDLGETDLATWATLLAAWSDLQRRLVPHEAEVLATGVCALRVEDAVAEVERQVELGRARPADDQLHLTREQAAGIRAGLPRVQAAVDELGQLGLPLSLDHNDLHTGNAFVPVGGRAAFFDLGDAMWGHPLTSSWVPLRAIAAERGWPRDDSRLDRVLDAALEPWTDLAPLPALRRGATAAVRLAGLHRHEAWRRVLAAVPDPAGALAYRNDYLVAATAPAVEV